MRRTAQAIAEHQSQLESVRTPNGTPNKRRIHPNSLKNLVAPWKPKESGNPGGRPKDLAAEIMRQVFENNAEAIYNSMAQEIIEKRSAYCFQVGSDRAFGKLKQGIIHTGDEEGGPINTSIKVEFVEPKP